MYNALHFLKTTMFNWAEASQMLLLLPYSLEITPASIITQSIRDYATLVIHFIGPNQTS